MSDSGTGHHHHWHRFELWQEVVQAATQQSSQANFSLGNLLFVDLYGEDNSIDLSKAKIILDSDTDQANAEKQSIGQDAGNAADGVVHDRHGHVRGTVEVTQAVTQDAAQDSVQVNGAVGNALVLSLAGETNDLDLEKATIVLESDIGQTNLSLEEIRQDAANLAATGHDGGHHHAVLFGEIAQSVDQSAAQSSEQSNDAVGNVFTIDLAGGDNSADLSGAAIRLDSDIEQSNVSVQSIEQNAGNLAAPAHDGGHHAVLFGEIAQSVEQSASQSSVQSNDAVGNLFSFGLDGGTNSADLGGAEIKLASDIDQSNVSDQSIEQNAGNLASHQDWAL